MNKDQLIFAKSKPEAIIPSKRTEDAGYDLFAADRSQPIVVGPCQTKEMNSGIGVACYSTYFPKLFDKGGYGSQGIIVSAGVGDSGFRDSYFICLINTWNDRYLVITPDSEESIAPHNAFCPRTGTFLTTEERSILSAYQYQHMEKMEEVMIRKYYVRKSDVLVKSIHKAITQMVMLPVPLLKAEEWSWDEFQTIASERGTGKKGSTGK